MYLALNTPVLIIKTVDSTVEGKVHCFFRDPYKQCKVTLGRMLVFWLLNVVAHKVTVRLQLVEQIGCSFRFNERWCSCSETGQDSGLFHP